MTKPDIEKAKQEALKLLHELVIKEPPVNPVKIAKELGLFVSFESFGDENSNVSGSYDAKKNLISVNKDDYFPRQMFTIGHEIGHFILHKSWLESSNGEKLYRETIVDYNSVGHYREREANKFAATLMAPKFMIDKYYKAIVEGDVAIERIAEIFAVSIRMFVIRLNEEYGYRT